MQIADTTIVLASLNPPSIWDFYGNVFEAAARESEANEYNTHLIKHGAPERTYQVMTYGEYKAAERRVYLAGPPTEITEETFIEMLEVLPPVAWTRRNNFESFLMSEHYSGPYTSQYARHGKRYYTKMVDCTDRSTWMTATTVPA